MAEPASGGGGGGGGAAHAGGGGGEGGGGGHEGGGHEGGVGVTITEDGGSVQQGGVGVSVSSEGVEVEREYEIWEGHYSVPTGVPGLNFVLDPSVKGAVGAGVGVEDGHGHMTVSASLTGEVQAGLSGGLPNIAEVYLTAGPTAKGSVQLTIDAHGLKEATARIDVEASAKVGVKVGGGALDYGYELGRANLFSFIGAKYERGKPFVLGTFQLGDKMRAALDWIKSAIDRARNLGSAAVSTIKNAAGATKDFVASSASSAYNYLTSW